MSMKVKNIDSQIRSIEEEIKALKALFKHLGETKKEKKTFASLKGVWKDKIHFTMEEIKESEIKV